MKYYHWIVENTKTGERYETITKAKRTPHLTGYSVIGCCGFHETPNTQRVTECNENEIL
jgi:hypothetical protein